METLVTPTRDDIRMSEAFEALMWALTRPGVPQPLAEPGLLPLAECLVDRETTVFAADAAFGAALAATGARPAPVESADYVFAPLADAADLARIAAVSIGDPFYPEHAATIFAPARIGAGPALRLSGPGIAGTAQLAVGGVDPAFWPLRARAAYPLGWDLFLVGEAEVVGIPRSTLVEVI
ncbi:phosphonate C-P lyase system protein PhnH [Acuticoccus sp. M5D2P5]|uniref:phosphonate C-P lyase system protein PhnH n=1 Tax=Acuticoccus kalidii TaxID=2910977 RepID=UPI001F27C963|nr:phosphonate C-P lyase system protein PhnH [Acuticoccus kalidii]MCF3936625.1 phosphonate C-P lyase system protein PhnH [Acuticoccus kalidii]